MSCKLNILVIALGILVIGQSLADAGITLSFNLTDGTNNLSTQNISNNLVNCSFFGKLDNFFFKLNLNNIFHLRTLP